MLACEVEYRVCVVVRIAVSTAVSSAVLNIAVRGDSVMEERRQLLVEATKALLIDSRVSL